MDFSKRGALAGVVATVLASAACTTVADDDVASSEREIIGGTPSQNPSVMTIAPGLCGATLIAPDVLLTAKHCVARLFPGPFECSETGEVLQIDRNVRYPDAGKFGALTELDLIAVGTLTTPSPYAPKVIDVRATPGAVICLDDAALLYLDRPVDDPVLSALRLDEPVTVGTPLIAVGYGSTIDAASSTTLQARDVTVVAVGPEPAVDGVTGAVPGGFFVTGEAVCRGDSGSPALTESGVVVGVASQVSRADLDDPTGTPSDCVSPLARSKYQSLAAIRDFVLDGLAAVGAVPWLEGEPDPRGGLADFGAGCREDSDCQSNACVDGDDGQRFCSHGCLSSACPDGYACELADDRMRCLLAPPELAPDAGGGDDLGESGGCGCGTADAGSGALLAAIMLALAARPRPRRRA